MHILIIEDEQKTAAYLKKGLKENSYVVDLADNGEDGLFYATQVKYDLIILDVTLPKRDGWSVLTQLRAQGNLCPVLMLTARCQTEEKVRGLELGADDYLVKPFAFSELLARIRCLLRRTTLPTSTNTLVIADLVIDFTQQKVTRNNQRINLTAKEFALLSLLARRKGELLSRTFIAEQVWDMNFDSDTNVVDVAIRRLRQKIDEGAAKKLIHTVYGVGYSLEERE